MSYALTDVVVSIHVAASNPILPIITVEEVITGGEGTLREVFQGGQVGQFVDLAVGKELRPLKEGEFAYLRGKNNGKSFIFTNAFTTGTIKKPWTFSRVSGSTG